MGALTKLIVQRLGERDQLVNTPRRVCGLPVTPSEAQVLGKGSVCQVVEFIVLGLVTFELCL